MQLVAYLAVEAWHAHARFFDQLRYVEGLRVAGMDKA
jgi:hypothetical protein